MGHLSQSSDKTGLNALSDFRDLYTGSCIVCGLGPSLFNLTYKVIQKNVTIGVNNIEQRVFTPDFLVVADDVSIKAAHGIEMYEAKCHAILNNRSNYTFSYYDLPYSRSKQIRYDYQCMYNTDIQNIYDSGNLFICKSSVTIALSLAIYMGFNRIGLIGFDLRGHIFENIADAIDEQYRRILDYCIGRDIELVNLSNESLLKSLPYQKLGEFC